MKTITVFFVGLFLCSFGRNAAAQLLISEYVEGTSNNKALEIWNVSTTNVTFGTNPGQLDVRVYVYANGSVTPTTTIVLTPGFTITSGDVFVLAHSSAVFAANADQTSTLVNWTGDDAIVLSIGAGTVLDSIGQVGFDPGTEWGTGLTSTADNTLRRPSTNLTGDVNVSDAYDPAVNFQGFATDSFDDLGTPPERPTVLEKAPLLISEYVEGTVNNRALEIWNVSTTNVTFGTSVGQFDVRVYVYANGSVSPTATNVLTAGFTLSPNQVFVLAHSSAAFAAYADQTNTLANWNGDDAVVLTVGANTVLDSIGQVGVDPGAEWGTGSTTTADHTLRRAFTNLTADVILTNAYDPAVNFQGFILDSFDELGVPPNGPWLEVQRSGTSAILSWTALAGGYQLQSNTNLLNVGTVWSNVSQVPVISGKRQAVTNNLLSPLQFYRLKK